MTTLVAIRQPLEVVSMSNQPSRTGKRLAAATDYEHDDDFAFVRKAKKAKTVEAELSTTPPRTTTTTSRTRRSLSKGTSLDREASPGASAAASRSTATATTTTTSDKQTSRRNEPFPDSSPQFKITKRATRHSPRRPVAETAPPDGSPRRRNGVASRNQGQTGHGSSRESGKQQKQQQQPSRQRFESPPPQEEMMESTKIALPMRDTPVINRNKEMRKKGGSNRRSSLGSRGRRASSLMESGQTAIPHKEVDAADFYKHIAADGLSEPRRMGQLLTWCAERALPEKPRRHGSLNASVILGARAIQDQLLKDFASRSDFSDWFSRDEDVPIVGVALQPNPKNTELDQKMAGLEARIKRLQEEKQAWLAIQKPPQELPPLFDESNEEDVGSGIVLPDFNLLDADEGKIHTYLATELESFDTVRARTESRIRGIQQSLEFEVDHLADNVHKLEQRVLAASKQADRVLAISAVRLKQREEREKTSAGTRDMPMMEILRSLSRILPEDGG